MTYWDGIIACGLVGQPVVSLAEVLDPVPSMDRLRQEVLVSFARTFNFMLEKR